ARWRPTVDNPAHCLLDHITKDDIPFRSPGQQRAGLTSVEIERTTYIGHGVRIRQIGKLSFATSQG
ncbi:MAG: hypothetical protein NDI91_17700, partial [Sulfuritalea sp.]|nr:hypothetical protein [Sulfuritalea sp.]